MMAVSWEKSNTARGGDRTSEFKLGSLGSDFRKDGVAPFAKVLTAFFLRRAKAVDAGAIIRPLRFAEIESTVGEQVGAHGNAIGSRLITGGLYDDDRVGSVRRTAGRD